MSKRVLLEITVESVEAAMAAEGGGADRIELCANLAQGGTTPGEELLRETRKKVALPIFSMVRPRAGNFAYSREEFAAMAQSIDKAKVLGMDGIVLGLLQEDGTVDVSRTRELVERAEPLPVTFHRAFDVAPNLGEALEDVIAAGAARILTSGGTVSANEGIPALAKLVGSARGRITIVPGGGITGANVAALIQGTGATEVHAGLSSVIPRRGEAPAAFEAAVKVLAGALANLASCS